MHRLKLLMMQLRHFSSLTFPQIRSDCIVAGDIRVKLNCVSSVAHTDFLVRVCRVDFAGKSFNVTENIFRVEGREPSEIMELDFSVGNIAWKIRAGERVAVHVASAAHPR